MDKTEFEEFLMYYDNLLLEKEELEEIIKQAYEVIKRELDKERIKKVF